MRLVSSSRSTSLIRRAAIVVVRGLLVLCAVAVHAAPMTADSVVETAIPSFALEQLSPEMAAALAELRPELRRDVESLELPSPLGTTGAGMRAEALTRAGRSPGTRQAGGSIPFDLSSREPGDAISEVFRDIVNVTPRSGERARGTDAAEGERSRDPTQPLDNAEWAREALKGVIGAMLQQNINERGEITFSMLGFGELGVFVSGDRGMVSITQGDNVLLVARRENDGPAAGTDSLPAHARAGGESDAGRQHAAPPPDVENLLARFLETVQEILSHPISLLTFGIVVLLAIIMQVLKLRSRSRRRRSRRRSSRGHRTQTVIEAVEIAPRRSRRRHRRGRGQAQSPSTQRA